MSASTESFLRLIVANPNTRVEVITLVNDIQLTGSSLVIPANKNIKLISTGGSAGTFFRLIGPSGKDTITIDNGGVLELAGITVTHTTGATGRGVANFGGTLIMSDGTISGNNGSGIHIEKGKATIKGGTINNNTAYDGGGVYNNGTLTMEGGTINNNKANNAGGGICNGTGTLTIKGGQISNNKANYGAGIHISIYGTFEMMTGGTINNNTANKQGGGIHNNSNTFTMKNGQIYNNRATQGGGIHQKGGTLIIENGTINNNKATSYGGGIYTTGIFTIKNGEINQNTANYGAGIYTSNPSTMEGGTINNNTSAKGNGGGIYTNKGTTTIKAGQICNNTATHYGGGVYHHSGTFSLEAGLISNNVALNYGGGIYHYKGNLTIKNGQINKNTATKGGGGIHNSYGIFTLEGGTISNNNTADWGGGIYNNGTLILKGGIIKNNKANNAGGGIYNRIYGNLTMTNGTVANNTATNGGGIYGDLTMTDGTITNNTATNGGGAIYHTNGNLTIQNGQINKNKATNGGGIFNNTISGTFTLEGGTISDNTATAYGGGIYNNNIVTFTMLGGTISSNTATGYGGAIYHNNGNITVKDTQIYKNKAMLGGGIANNATNSTFLMENGTITNNTATNGGGAIYSNGNLTMTSNTITNNTTINGNGGAIYSNGNLTIQNGQITNNTATNGNGGAIYSNGNLTIQNGQINKNKANYGAGVFNNTVNGTFILFGGTISDNIATISGGGIYTNNTITFTMNGGAITNNTATNGNGGGICHYSGTCNLLGGTISNNTATNGGGAIHHNNGNLTIQNGQITNNTATNGNGGAIWVTNLNNLYIDTEITSNKPQTIFSGNTALQAFNRHPDHDTLYADRIKSKDWSNAIVPGTANTFKLSQGYNNHDINYTYTKAAKFGNCKATFNIISLNDTETITWTINTTNGQINQPNNTNTNVKELFKKLFQDPILAKLVETYEMALWYEDKSFPKGSEWNFNTPLYERDIVLYAFDNIVYNETSAQNTIEHGSSQRHPTAAPFNDILIRKDINLTQPLTLHNSPTTPQTRNLTYHNISNNSQVSLDIDLKTARHFEITCAGAVKLDFGGQVILRGPEPLWGGGIELKSTCADVTLVNANITQCKNEYGGAIYVNDLNTLRLKNSTIHNNYAALGGAIYHNSTSALHLTNSTIEANTAENEGGGIWIALEHLNQLYIDAPTVFLGNVVPGRPKCIKQDNDEWFYRRLYEQQIKATTWSRTGQGYNNYDINYPSGDTYYCKVYFASKSLENTTYAKLSGELVGDKIRNPLDSVAFRYPVDYEAEWAYDYVDTLGKPHSGKWKFDMAVPDLDEEFVLCAIDNVVFDAESAKNTINRMIEKGDGTSKLFEHILVKKIATGVFVGGLEISGSRHLTYQKLFAEDSDVVLRSEAGMRHFRILGGAVTFRGVKLQGQNNNSGGELSGGGLEIGGEGTVVVLDDGVIEQCKNDVGGAVWVHTKATFKLTNSSEICGNTATDGGGIYNGGGTLSVSGGSRVCDNVACAVSDCLDQGHGGGVYNNGGVFTMSDNSVICGNAARDSVGTDNYSSGGGVHNHVSGTFIMNDGSICNNETCASSSNTSYGYGGGVCNKGSFTMNAGKISDNTAIASGGVGETEGYGGGVYNSGTFAMPINTVSGSVVRGEISGNTASHDGGGVYNEGVFEPREGTIKDNTVNNKDNNVVPP